MYRKPLFASALMTLFLFSASAETPALQKRPAAGLPTVEASLTTKGIGPGLPFIENIGQVSNGSARFYYSTFAGTVFVTDKNEIVYRINKYTPHNDMKETKSPHASAVFKETLKNSLTSEPSGAVKGEASVSYFKGPAEDWKKDIPVWQEVDAGEVYKGIGLRLRAYKDNIEKIFTVFPGGDTEDISIGIEGAENLNINSDGELDISTGLGTIKMTAPVAYQELDGARIYVDTSYSLKAADSYGFYVGEYDRSRPLVIDPFIASTFMGGGADDQVNAVITSPSGDIYVAGHTYSTDFPTTTGVYDSSHNNNADIFISKLSGDLKTLYASTYIGGGSSEYPWAIALDASGSLFVTGSVVSYNFPKTTGAYDETRNPGPSDIFISKLSSDLTSLMASTFFGGSDEETAFDIAVHTDGSVYITGETRSNDLPATTGAYDETHNGMLDGFIAHFSSDLSALTASTYLGGSDEGDTMSIAIDPSGDIYVAGDTFSADYPTTAGAYQTAYSGTCDGIVSKLSGDLTTLMASTYLGGTGREYAFLSIALASDGSVYFSGMTASSDFPVTTSTFGGNYDLFISKLSGDLTTLSASRFLGGSNYDETNTGNFLSLDSNGNVYVAGNTNSADFPVTTGAHDETCGTNGNCDYNGSTAFTDVFVTKLSSDLVTILESTYLGGAENDHTTALVVDSSDNIYVVGSTSSPDFPTGLGGYDGTCGTDGTCDHTGTSVFSDAFIAKFNLDLTYPYITKIVDSTGSVGMYTSIAIDSSDKVHISYYDSTNSALKYATNASGSWVKTTVDNIGSVGKWTSIAIDSSDKAHISYYDSTNSALKHATNTSGSWVKTTVDSTGNVGWHTSIAIDSSDKAHISYQDPVNYCLKYTTNTSGSWIINSVDCTQEVGRDNSIAIDSLDKAHISYSDTFNPLLHYATNASGSWVTTNVDYYGSSATSIAIDSSDKVHISYTSGDLKYATNASNSWVINTLDIIGPASSSTYIAIDKSDKLHVSYYDASTSALKYVSNVPGSWVTSTLDNAGAVGDHSSIAIDSLGKVHISYYDYTNADLKYMMVHDLDGDGYITEQGDCNDSNPAINPGVIEIPLNGIDDDCNANTFDGWQMPLDSSVRMYVAGADFKSNGILADVGDQLAAFDAGGSLIGLATVETAGIYSMSINGDDALTTGIDEGAAPGEEISFRFWDRSNLKQLSGLDVEQIIPGSDSPPYYRPSSVPITFTSGAFVHLVIHVAGNNALPVADSGGPYLIDEGLPALLDGSGSADPDGTITLYQWDIDDDGTFDYASISPTQSHIFTQHGPHTVTLRVTDDMGAVDESSVIATVQDTSPTAGFTGNPTSGMSPLTVNFTNSSTGYDQPLIYAWDFDLSGSTGSTATSPSYDYVSNGLYSVKLTVTDSDGSTNSLTRTSYIDVNFCLSPVRITGGANAYHSLIDTAYSDAWDGDEVDAQALSFAEDLIFNLNKAVWLRGGYDCSYSTNPDITIINGNVRISDGVVTLENIRIQ